MVNNWINFIELNVEGMFIMDKHMMQEDKFNPLVLRPVLMNVIETVWDMLLICWFHKYNH